VDRDGDEFEIEEVMTMPGGDRTGPNGLGPMTGRRAGYCAGYPVPGYMNRRIGWAGGPYAAMPYGSPYAYLPRFARGYGRRPGAGRWAGRGRGRGRFLAPLPW
jgi:hypothetical protein